MHQADVTIGPVSVADPRSGAELQPSAPVVLKPRPSWMRQLVRQRLALTGLCLVALFVVVAIGGGWAAPYSFSAQHVRDRLQPPSSTYLLGTDEFGRDLLSRLLVGAGISFQVGLISVGISGISGVLLGLIAGYTAGWLDAVLTLCMDVLLAFPAVL